jgi:phospholipid/cholesterol/gamma-HCH transport system substrate-binding protein
MAFASWYTFHVVTEGIGGSNGYEVYALFNDATGLVDKSMVQIAGLRVGQITSRSLYKNKAKIELFIKKSVVLYENAVVSKKVTSLMGGFYLEIDPGTPTIVDAVSGQARKSKILKPGDRITIVLEPTTTSDIIEKVGDLMPEIKKLVVEIRKLSTNNVKRLVDNTNDAISTNSKALKKLLDHIDSVTGDIKSVTSVAPRDVGVIMANIKATSRDLRKIVGTTGFRIQGMGDSVQTSLEKISKLIDKLDSSMDGGKNIVNNTEDITKDIKDITAKIKRGEGTVGKFITSATIADDVEKITGGIKDLVGGLANIETIVGLRTEYNLMANTVKTYMSVEIFPRQDKYYLVELIDDPRGLRSTSYTVTRTDNPVIGPALYREEKINVTDAFRFSFMFAKKIDFFTFRFGIKESTGGAGVDLNLFDNKFQVHADVFDFSANIFPRVKVGIMWQFYRRMFIIAGIDDLMNERPRTGAGGGIDFYIGAQVRFSDEDLKSLLMIGGSALSGVSGGK